MAEIKLNDGFRAEVEALRAAGEALGESGVHPYYPGGESLPTPEAYMKRFERIRSIMYKMSLLIRKDTADMVSMAARLEAADNSHS